MDKDILLDKAKKFKYTIRITEEDRGGYFIRIEDFPGCMSHGETMEEAIKNIQEARNAWLKVTIEDCPDKLKEIIDKNG